VTRCLHIAVSVGAWRFSVAAVEAGARVQRRGARRVLGNGLTGGCARLWEGSARSNASGAVVCRLISVA